MRVLLGLAALAAVTPAQAQSFTSATFGAANANNWATTPPEVRRHRGDGRMHTRIHRGFPAAYAYSGYEEEGDFDGNRSFDPDRWNDWWHDRPDRAYPRWMTHNQDCARKWFSGDVLTC